MARGGAFAVAAQLLNPYPLVRQWAAGALEKIAPGRCSVDLSAADSTIARQAAACGAEAASIRLPAAPGAVEDPED